MHYSLLEMISVCIVGYRLTHILMTADIFLHYSIHNTFSVLPDIDNICWLQH